MNLIEKIKSNSKDDYSDDQIIRVLFEMSKFKDREFTLLFREFQKTITEKIDSHRKKIIRKVFYLNEDNESIQSQYKVELPKLIYGKTEIIDLLNYFSQKINDKNENKILQSISKRLSELNIRDNEKNRAKLWLSQYNQKNNYSNILLKYKLSDKIDFDSAFSEIIKFVNRAHEKLSNYRHLHIMFEGELESENRNHTMSLISKIAVYMENFLSYKGSYSAYKKQNKINDLTNFIYNNDYLYDKFDLNKINAFYENISYGFQFDDFLVSKDTKIKILIMRKIELDDTPVNCPACLEKKARGNSFSSMFLKSWECSNPSCSERSKSGRGKRFDEYGSYRYFNLVLNNDNNKINNEIYKKWRKDIFEDKNSIDDMILLFYSFHNEKVLFINFKAKKSHGRLIEYKDLKEFISGSNHSFDFKAIPIIKLFDEVSKNIKTYSDKSSFKDDSIIKGDSREILKNANKMFFGAITSPPYYNAREYSQWNDLVMYLIDMMIVAKYVYDSLKTNSTYVYNIADVIDQDNIYIVSNMSKRRIMLGFYSAIIFEAVGFHLNQDIFWYKGEVQSKRNSTSNHFSGYVKFINCYEHNLVFQKGDEVKRSPINLVEISPVIKINSKGINIYGHSAPYPEKIVGLLENFIKPDDLILDPFSGSGTTAIWAKKNGYKFVAIELNEDYYQLSKKRLMYEVAKSKQLNLFDYE